MKLIPMDIKELEVGYRPTKIYKLLMEFHESDLDCAEIVDYPQKDAKSCQTVLINARKRYGLYNIKVHVVRERVFLVKDQISKD